MEGTRKILRVPQVAQMLGCTKWCIYQKVKRRQLTAHQEVPRSPLYFFEDEVIAYVEGMRKRPADEINRIANNF